MWGANGVRGEAVNHEWQERRTKPREGALPRMLHDTARGGEERVSDVCRAKWMISDGMKAADRAAASRWRGHVTGRDKAAGERSIINGPRAKKKTTPHYYFMRRETRWRAGMFANAAGRARVWLALREVEMVFLLLLTAVIQM